MRGAVRAPVRAPVRAANRVAKWVLKLRARQGGAVGPGLKSRSCRTASGTGGLVSRPLGSPDLLGTGSACCTVIES